MIKQKEIIWTTSSGKTIRIDQMNDEHLNNAINFCKRKAEQLHEESLDGLAIASSFSSDSMASYYSYGESDDLFKKADRYREWVRILEIEQFRRDILECSQTTQQCKEELEKIESKLGERYGVTENIREFLIDLDKKNQLYEDELVSDWHSEYSAYKNYLEMDAEDTNKISS